MTRFVLLSFCCLLFLGCNGSDVSCSSCSRIDDQTSANESQEVSASGASSDETKLSDEQRAAIKRINSVKKYEPEMLALSTAEVEIQVYNDETDETTLKAWKDKWEKKCTSFKLTGGCGCCVDIYTVTGPKAAIEEFPISEYRRKYYPKYQ